MGCWKIPVTEKERARIMRLSQRHSAAEIAVTVGRPTRTVENILARENRRLLDAMPCDAANRQCSPAGIRFRVGAGTYCIRHAAEAGAVLDVLNAAESED